MIQDLGSASSSRRRRSLDAEINLVPFIDLLSMCICFLLMTAVWLQTGVVEVKQSRGTSAVKPTGPYELTLTFMNATSIELVLKKNERVAKKTTVKGEQFQDLLKTVEQEIKNWPIQDPKNRENTLVSAAFVKPANGVSYGSLVAMLDVLRKQRITNLGVLPVAGVL